jgi:hypothetical protein
MTTKLGDRLVTNDAVPGFAKAVHAHAQYNYLFHGVSFVGIRAV